MPQPAGHFTIDDARRVLDDVFAPWIKELALSIESIEPSDGQKPGAVLRLPFSDRLCRDNGIVCGQALMAIADAAMVIAMVAANSGYQPMTTVDQTTHAHGRLLGRAGRCAGGPAWPHHGFRPGHAVERSRRQAGRDGLECMRCSEAAHATLRTNQSDGRNFVGRIHLNATCPDVIFTCF